MLDAARRQNNGERVWLKRFLRVAPRHSAMLDLGCGGGEPNARATIDNGHAVTGVDISAQMIRLARTRFPRHQWIEGDMRHFSAAPGSFGGILMRSSLMHLERKDHGFMLGRISHWLCKGGVALFNTGTPYAPEVAALLNDTSIDAPFRDSLTTAEYRELLGKYGLTVINHVIEDMTCGGTTIWLVGKS